MVRRRKLIERAGIVIVAVIAVAPLEAQDAQERDRFELFNDCLPVGLSVFLYDDEGDLPELTEERVQTLAESRLRAARLFHQGIIFNRTRLLTGGVLVSVLPISVDVVGQAVAGSVSLSKPVNDPRSGVTGFISTWERSFMGTHRGDADSIMQRLSELVDTFVLEYLRVNEESCNDA